MCGIAGIYARSPGDYTLDGAKMAQQLEHRGPDNTTVYPLPNGVMVHTRLSIIDLEHGNQPLSNQDESLQLVANGEIYNFIELRQELEKNNAQFKTHSDCETILHAYAEHSQDFVQRLNGMFAFALNDTKRKTLTLARDRLGIKPLFYTVHNDRVIFASEIKAILIALDSIPDLIQDSLQQFLQNQFISGRETMYQGIYKVLPGEIIEFDASLQKSSRQYWDPINRVNQFEYEDDLYAHFNSSFNTVIEQHIRSDVPFGLFLSGGADSAILLAMLSQFHAQPISTFSVGFKGRDKKNETNDAQYIAEKFNSKHHTLLLDSDDIINRIPQMTWTTDDLMRDYASLPTLALAEYAAQDLKVVFSGEGGDEAFAGYRRYHPRGFESQIKGLIHPGTQGFRTRGQLGSLALFFRDHSIPVKSDFRTPFRNAWQSCPKHWSFMQKAQYTDIKTALCDNLLVKSDRMLMAFGLEGRVPFVDHRVIEFGLALPDQYKYQDKKGKFFLKKWAEQYIPPDYLHRKKRGFYVPIDSWLTQASLQKQLKQKLIGNQAIQHWFDTDKINQLFKNDRHIKKYSRHIMCLMQFAIWHNMSVNAFRQRPSSNENIFDWL
jgi:asparagine synthase (glutamine-hydrolysing)